MKKRTLKQLRQRVKDLADLGLDIALDENAQGKTFTNTSMGRPYCDRLPLGRAHLFLDGFECCLELMRGTHPYTYARRKH